MVIGPAILCIGYPYVLRVKVIDGIRIDNSVLHILGPLDSVVVLVVLIGVDCSPPVKTLLCPDTYQAAGLCSFLFPMEPATELNLKVIVPL